MPRSARVAASSVGAIPTASQDASSLCHRPSPPPSRHLTTISGSSMSRPRAPRFRATVCLRREPTGESSSRFTHERPCFNQEPSGPPPFLQATAVAGAALNHLRAATGALTFRAKSSRPLLQASAEADSESMCRRRAAPNQLHFCHEPPISTAGAEPGRAAHAGFPCASRLFLDHHQMSRRRNHDPPLAFAADAAKSSLESRPIRPRRTTSATAATHRDCGPVSLIWPYVASASEPPPSAGPRASRRPCFLTH